MSTIAADATTEAAAGALLATGPVPIETGLTEVGDNPAAFVARPPGWEIEPLDLEPLRAAPSRKRGKFALHDADSFVAYVKAHASVGTTQWGDVAQRVIIAVLDDHGPSDSPVEGAGWGEHHAVYRPRTSPAWDFWIATDRKDVRQDGFVRLIEDGLGEIAQPDAAELYESVQDFRLAIEGKVTSLARQRNATVQVLVDEETKQATHGGLIELPERLLLRMPVFEEGEPIDVTARLTYRFQRGNDGGGTVTFQYRMDRPEAKLREAFAQLLDKVRADSGLPVLAGHPRL